MIVLPDAENRTIVYSFVWTKHQNVTDGQTELVWLLQRSALLAMRTRCNNVAIIMMYYGAYGIQPLRSLVISVLSHFVLWSDL